MGPLPILSVIHTITIGTMLNFNCGNNGHGLQNVACKHTSVAACKRYLWRVWSSWYTPCIPYIASASPGCRVVAVALRTRDRALHSGAIYKTQQQCNEGYPWKSPETTTSLGSLPLRNEDTAKI